MSPKPRRQFTNEQKAETVRIVVQADKSITRIAKEIELTESALRNWVKQAEIDQKQAPNRPLTTEPRQQTLANGARLPNKSNRLLLRTSCALMLRKTAL